MDRWANKLAVVTGASAGIGAAIVKDLIKNNIRVIGLARRPEKIEEIRKELSDIQRNLLNSIKYETFKIMKENNIAGHIIFINSTLGHEVTKAPISFNIYSPTKFSITAMSISPGLVKTDIVPQEIINSKIPAINPEDIANAVCFALSTPPEVQISELTVEPHPAY
ncbi:dehydrogenase/reductase SDR family member 11-like [Condylostylus longicornis]|uniref:dehydrogenase/reductase SDR family member 11-like n=1 Tax=Condylostylus longicornis TaxID=2530218 RepID=UPI00244DD834|nr:dehydrogenase/reductase SDR family member 11-like [Condylostylus longicornis]